MAYIGAYYGVDWLAMILTILSIYDLGQKRRRGFILGMGANVAWFTFGVMAGSVANPVANVIFLSMNFKGFLNWREKRQLTESAN